MGDWDSEPPLHLHALPVVGSNTKDESKASTASGCMLAAEAKRSCFMDARLEVSCTSGLEKMVSQCPTRQVA